MYISENEIKHAMQKEEMQYRLAITISSRAQSNREHIREIVQESGWLETRNSVEKFIV